MMGLWGMRRGGLVGMVMVMVTRGVVVVIGGMRRAIAGTEGAR